MTTYAPVTGVRKVLKTFQALLLVMTLVTMSFPASAFTARADEGEGNPENTNTEQSAPALDCEAQGLVLNEAGDACVEGVVEDEGEGEPEVLGARFSSEHHDNDDDDDEDEDNDDEDKVNICHETSSEQNPWQAIQVAEQGWNGHSGHDDDFVYAGPTKENGKPDNKDGNADEWCAGHVPTEDPKDDPEEDTTEDGQCVVVSNTLDMVDSHPAVLAFVHASWVHTLESVAKWIWSENPTANTTSNVTKVFTKTFSLVNVPTSASLELSADNGYLVKVNGVTVDDRLANPTYEHNYDNVHTVALTGLVAGDNTIEVTVANFALSGSDGASNPAGLIYKITAEGADCGEPEKEVENSCLAPTAEGASAHINVNGAPGSEDDLEDLIGSSDVDDDQVNYQTWDATGNDVDFVVTYHGKKANSGDKHVFGWFNGATFTPVFRDADITAGADAYDALPLLTTEGQTANFSVTGVGSISFGILDTTSGKYYSTDKANTLNGDSADHTVVYNPSADTYTIGIEDLPNGGDHDFEDVVVSLTTECSPTEDTITVVATKIVCDNESDLPNVMGSNHVTDEDTAAEFLAAHPETCRAVPDWQFEWANNGADGGNATTGHVVGYTTSGLTAANGTVSMSIPLVGGDEIHLREVLKPGYIPFKGGTSDTVSAEFACSNDGLNYDNWDFIRNPEEGETYYCVAWNVAEEDETPVCNPEINLVANGGFEAPDVTNGAGWDVFEVGTSPALVWLADFLGAAPGGKVEIHGGVNGWLASEGTQYTELDSDLNGPSSPGGVSAVEIAQNLSTVSGRKYHVSFDFSARPGTAATENSVGVYADGNPVGIVSAVVPTAGNQTEWASYGFDFTAGDANTLLALRDLGAPNNSVGTFVDNVKVTCVPEEVEETGTLVIEKYTEGGDGEFEFNVNPVTELELKTLNSTVTVETEEGYGEEEVDLDEGTYNLTENVPEGWTLDDWSCEYEGESEGNVIENGENIYIEAGETVTCSFYNSKDEQGGGEDTSETIVVSPNDFAGWALFNYDNSNDTDTSATTVSGTTGSFVFGPTGQPLGAGSFEQVTGTDGNDATRLRTSQFNGVPLGDLTGLSYETYVAANGGAQATYVQIRIDRDADGTWDDALFFEPVYQNGGYGMLYGQPAVPNQCVGNPNCVSLDEWQTWDLSAGGWWSNVDSAGGPPLTTLAAYAAEYPDAVLATDTDSVRMQAGFGAPVWDNFKGNFDKFVIGVKTGANTHTITFDFEPVTNEGGGENPTDVCNNIDGIQSSLPSGFQFDGDGGCFKKSSTRGTHRHGGGGGGEVLGASTCGPLLTSYLKLGWANDADQVSKLQDFLNTNMGAALPVSGFFGPATFEAVKAFQKAHWEDVLKPWIGLPGSGIEGENTPTGFVYQTTRWQINNIFCPGSEAFPAKLD